MKYDTQSKSVQKTNNTNKSVIVSGCNLSENERAITNSPMYTGKNDPSIGLISIIVSVHETTDINLRTKMSHIYDNNNTTPSIIKCFRYIQIFVKLSCHTQFAQTKGISTFFQTKRKNSIPEKDATESKNFIHISFINLM